MLWWRLEGGYIKREEWLRVRWMMCVRQVERIRGSVGIPKKERI
jgi:hypothetical protein